MKDKDYYNHHINKTYNYLTINSLDWDYSNKSHRRLVAKCTCKCGILTELLLHSVISGRTKSCGCLKFNISHKDVNVQHGQLKHGAATRSDITVEYSTYHRILNRCYNFKNQSYVYYGGRGIKVCDRWLDKEHGFTNFLEDMGNRPDNKTSIDRINPDGDYSPENCRWSDKIEQARNKRHVKKWTFQGQTKKIYEWYDLFEITSGAYHSRAARTGVLYALGMKPYYEVFIDREYFCLTDDQNLVSNLIDTENNVICNTLYCFVNEVFIKKSSVEKINFINKLVTAGISLRESGFFKHEEIQSDLLD